MAYTYKVCVAVPSLAGTVTIRLDDLVPLIDDAAIVPKVVPPEYIAVPDCGLVKYTNRITSGATALFVTVRVSAVFAHCVIVPEEGDVNERMVGQVNKLAVAVRLFAVRISVFVVTRAGFATAIPIGSLRLNPSFSDMARASVAVSPPKTKIPSVSRVNSHLPGNTAKKLPVVGYVGK